MALYKYGALSHTISDGHHEDFLLKPICNSTHIIEFRSEYYDSLELMKMVNVILYVVIFLVSNNHSKSYVSYSISKRASIIFLCRYTILFDVVIYFIQFVTSISISKIIEKGSNFSQTIHEYSWHLEGGRKRKPKEKGLKHRNTG